ncbi:MAG: NAD/NADP octopine/nopaline dehydrogenase family protein [Eubacteriales bacterium]|nr:NAD/NADP octopine/nopaline dehydrogenase family protein [Eubacteriales bacterium]MDD4323794.1 NAD/NADP octopine/nopaline dehydrogenase family protein [Eubacteriales bacterium]MDD4541123.1 NAD/NADP octopine/nopaline dehydrogenase family protein [Eubacteriales bacterium]
MKTTIIGAGNTGLAMAAHLALAGNEVYIYDHNQKTVDLLQESKSIRCSGVIQNNASIACATSDVAVALEDTDLIIIMTPAFAHKELAILIGKNLKKEAPIILSPGRTFGAIEFQHYFNLHNNSLQASISETQTVIHTARRYTANSVHIIAIKDSVYLATLEPNQSQEVLSNLPDCIRDHFSPAKSVIQTSIGNIGMILHCAPLLLNSGWTESPEFGFKHYWDGISPRIAKFLEKIDHERVEISKALGCEVISTMEWLNRSYHSEGDTLFERIRDTPAYEAIDAPETLEHRYIFEDVPCGLVPLEAIGKYLGIDMKHTSLIVDLASTLLEVDFRETGRNLRDFNLEKFFPVLSERGAHEIS